MKKKILVLFAAVMLPFVASASQAAIVELSELSEIQPGISGDMQFGVYLTDMGSLPNIDIFNVGIEITGASGLQLSADNEGPNPTDYIFYGNSFSFLIGNLEDDLSQLVFGDATADGIGEDLLDGDLLGWVTLSYPALDPGVLTFSLIPGWNYAESDADSGYMSEDLFLSGETALIVTPIPGTIWILGGGILVFSRFRRQWRPGC